MVEKSIKMFGTQQRIAGNGTITVPRWVREQLNKRPGDKIKVFFPINQGEDYSGLLVKKREEKSPTRKVSAPLYRQPEKIAKLKEIWKTGQRNGSEIARQIGAKDDSVNRWIKKHLGELNQ
jgi:bifunctional DNA-binding transcriptional regulator/antitoxin component of YhaV-PrlF toxin-antitoxin module